MTPLANQPAFPGDFERRREAFDLASAPIIKQMVELHLMFTAPWMRVRDGVVVESGVEWTDSAAKRLYEQYEETIRLLVRMYFPPAALETTK